MLAYCKQVIKKYPNIITKCMTIILVTAIMNAFLPYIIRLYIEKTRISNSYLSVIKGLIGILIFYLVCTMVRIMWYYVMDKLGGLCISDLSIRLQAILSDCSMSKIEENQMQRIKHILYADVLDVFRVVGHHLPSLMGGVLVVCISIIISICIDYTITLFLFFSLIIGFLLTFFSKKMIIMRAGKTNQKLKMFHSICDEYVEMILTIQSNNLTKYYAEKTKKKIDDFISTSQDEDKIQIFWTDIVRNYNSIIKLLISVILAMPKSGESIVNLVFFTIIADMMLNEAQSIQLLIQQIIKAKPSFINIEDIVMSGNRFGKTIIKSIDSITFENVFFKYPEQEKFIINNFNLQVKRGEAVLIKGENGSGKSTIFKLLLGLYNCNNGVVLYNCIPNKMVDKDSINNNILYVGQEEKLLNETIYDYLNIVCRKTYTGEQFHYLEEKIGIDFSNILINNNGLSLSVGQRKKILLMKLMMRVDEASIILIDEISAGLDVKTKEIYYELLKEIISKRDKIIIVIDHEISDRIMFDKIVCL